MKELIETLIEVERLKRLDRTGWTLRGLPNGTESVAAHSFGVGVTAMLLADELLAKGLAVNVERALRLALIHDWAEVRLGDLPKTAKRYLGKENSNTAEQLAFADVVSSAKEGALYEQLHHEYEQRSSIESHVVKLADIVDLLVETLALERAGAQGLDEFWDVARSGNNEFAQDVQRLADEIFAVLLAARRETQR